MCGARSTSSTLIICAFIWDNCERKSKATRLIHAFCSPKWESVTGLPTNDCDLYAFLTRAALKSKPPRSIGGLHGKDKEQEQAGYRGPRARGNRSGVWRHRHQSLVHLQRNLWTEH